MKNRYYKRWKLMAPLGLIIVGFGVCLIAESAMLKYDGVPTWKWVASGTFSLIVFNSGLCVFGDAIISRVRFLQLKDDK